MNNMHTESPARRTALRLAIAFAGTAMLAAALVPAAA